MITCTTLWQLTCVDHIDQATNGQQALDLIKQKQSYDIIFMGLEMPIMNGYETCNKIIKFFKTNKVINSSKIVLSELPVNELREMYDDIKYQSLDNRTRPYIFAYSSPVTQEIVQRTMLAGFDGCLSLPL